MHRKSLLALALAIASPAAFAEIPKQLQICKADDSRVRVTEWTPRFNGAALLTRPSAEDGDVVYMEFLLDSAHAGCAGAKPDHLYSFGHSYGEDEGGISMNLRGNVQFANGMCYFAGFYMNETVMGMHQGWTETYFRPLDKAEVLTSGRYCRGSGASRAPLVNESPAEMIRVMCSGIALGQHSREAGVCAAYIRGHIDGENAQSLRTGTSAGSCPPPGTTVVEMARLFNERFDRLAENQRSHITASDNLQAALAEAYPCL